MRWIDLMTVGMKAPRLSGPRSTVSPTATALLERRKVSPCSTSENEKESSPSEDNARDDRTDERYRENVRDGELKIGVDGEGAFGGGGNQVEEGANEVEALAGHVGD